MIITITERPCSRRSFQSKKNKELRVKTYRVGITRSFRKSARKKCEMQVESQGWMKPQASFTRPSWVQAPTGRDSPTRWNPMVLVSGLGSVLWTRREANIFLGRKNLQPLIVLTSFDNQSENSCLEILLIIRLSVRFSGSELSQYFSFVASSVAVFIFIYFMRSHVGIELHFK